MPKPPKPKPRAKSSATPVPTPRPITIFDRKTNGTFLLSLDPDKASPEDFIDILSKIPLRGGLQRLNKKVITNWLMYFKQNLLQWAPETQQGMYRELGRLFIKCYLTEIPSMRIMLEVLDPEMTLHEAAYREPESIAKEESAFNIASSLERAAEGRAILTLRNASHKDTLTVFTELTAHPENCSVFFFYHYFTAEYEELKRVEAEKGWGYPGNSDFAHKFYSDLIKKFQDHASNADETKINSIMREDGRLPGLFATIYFDEYNKRRFHPERSDILDEAITWAGLGAKGIDLNDHITEPIACKVMGESFKLLGQQKKSYEKYLKAYESHLEKPQEPPRDYHPSH